MREVLNKIFLRKLGLGKFALSAIAFVFGLTLVLLALQGYVKVRELLAPRKNTSDFIIINKEVDLGHTILGGKAQFSSKDVEELRSQPFVDGLGIFRSNNFEARAFLGGNLGFSTELFFESVPDEFLDTKPHNFRWEEGDNFLPLIISQDFLNLYNFGYAIGRGTPQLSKSTVQMVPLKVEVYGPAGREVFDAKVVGFSERIASILVPNEFLVWANDEVGSGNNEKVSRMILKVKSDQSARLEEYMKEHNISVSDEKLKFGKVMTIINILMSVLVFIGTAFMVFALIIAILNFSLMVAQAREEVSLLLQLGYKGKQLAGHLSSYLLVFIAIVALGAALLFGTGNYFLMDFLSANGMDVSSGISFEVILVAVGTLGLSLAVSRISIHRLIRKQL